MAWLLLRSILWGRALLAINPKELGRAARRLASASTAFEAALESSDGSLLSAVRCHAARSELTNAGRVVRALQGAMAPEMAKSLELALRDIAELGRELARLGWSRRLADLRVFYAAIATGRSSTECWNLSHLERMRSVLGLGPTPLPIAKACPQCPPPEPGAWSGTRTSMHLEDRWVCQCSSCGAEWVVLEAK